MEQENDYQEESRKRGPFDALIPRKEYFFTPILLNINLLIFVVMIFYGVSPMAPTGDQLIEWGANYRPKTLGGEPWRLFTSMFLHFGVIHIAFNMYALYSLGSMLEPFIGRWRFLVLYLVSGLGGSAVSLWWHDDNAVAAGASGAIFGIFGVLAALLTTNLIDPSVRGQMLKSVAISIGLNLMIGLSGGIDNSAHIGGLLTGAMGGYLCYFDLRAWYQRRIKQNTGLVAAVVLSAGVVVGFWMMTPPPAADPRSLLIRFDEEDARARQYLRSHELTTETSPAEIKKKIVEPWEHCASIIDSLAEQGVQLTNAELMPLLRKYANARTEGAYMYYRAASEKDSLYLDSADIYMNQAQQVENRIESLMAPQEK